MAAPAPNTPETKAFLRVLTKHVSKPAKINTADIRVIDTVKNREVPIATAHRSIAQLKRRADRDIRAHFQLPRGFVYSPDMRIVHKSMVTKEVVRANGATIRAQVEAQRQRMTPEEKAELL